MTIFSKIIAGQMPCYKIKEDDLFIAFLDITPIEIGHVLVVPKIEIDKLYNLPDNYLAAMLLFAQPIAKAIEKALPCKRVGLAVIGLEVPHAHLHLVPINTANDLNFTKEKLNVSPAEFIEFQGWIVDNLED